VKVGAILGPRVDAPAQIVLAERLGYERAWVFDSPALFADPWMTLARAADGTSRIRLGVAVITPRMRHLIANAGAIATLSALAPGRVDVVIGAGFTSQAMVGKGPVRWAEVEEYAVALRALLRGEAIDWDGGVVALRPGKLTGLAVPCEVPIWVAAHGPKGYAVGERVGDAILTNPGHGEGGEDGAGGPRIERWAQFNATILGDGEALDSERVIDAGGPPAALHLHLGDGGAARGSAEATAYAERLAAIDARVRHLEMHRGHLAEVTELERDLVTAELIARTTSTGTAAEVRAHLAAIAAEGFAGIVYAPMGPDVPGELRAMAELLELAA
jgi:5,10-methylenetetrahydromethanopterin reductase